MDSIWKDIIDTSPEGIVVFNLTGDIRWINQTARAWLTADSPAQVALTDLHPSWVCQALHSSWLPASLARGVWSGPSALLDQDGSERPIHQTLTCHRDRFGQPWFAARLWPITAAETGAPSLLTARPLDPPDVIQRGVLQALPLTAMAFDPDAVCTNVWAYNEALLPTPRSALLGCTIGDAFASYEGINPEDLFRDALTQNNIERCATLKRGDQKLTVSLWLTRIATADGVRVVCFTLEQAELDRTHQERLALQERLRTFDRFEGLEILAGGIAHDFNNLLAGIVATAEAAQLEPTADANVRGAMGAILNATQHAAQLTDQLLSYSAQGAIAQRPIALSDLIDGLRPLLQGLIRGRVHLHIAPTNTAGHVHGDEGRLRQAILNLIINAVEAIGDTTGHVHLDVHNRILLKTDLDRIPHADTCAEGRYAIVTIRDDGPGMDNATMRRMFEPFFSTKPNGHGLGLSAVQGIARQHHGWLDVESAPGRGTTVRIGLPAIAHSKHPTPPRIMIADDETTTPTGRILLVDDEAQVRRALTRLLHYIGWEVLVAKDGAEAITSFEANHDALTMVLMDVTMPGITGIKVMRSMARIAPDVPVILMSGYSAEDFRDQTQSPNYQGILHKPFRRGELKGCLDRCLALRNAQASDTHSDTGPLGATPPKHDPDTR